MFKALLKSYRLSKRSVYSTSVGIVTIAKGAQ